MALSTMPKLLLADEPTTALDVTLQAQVINLRKDIIKDKGGIPSSSVSSKTNYLICGENPGSKLRKAEEFGIELVKEENLKEFLKI